MRKYFLYAALVLAMSIPAQSAFPAIRMPGVFGDNMVVRHGQETRIWGRAAPGEWVTVDFAGEKITTRASESGQWDTWVGPVEAGGPYELKVSGTTTYVIYKNVMAGDVWVAGGQSNMEWAVSQAADAAKEIEAADYPEIRFLRVPKAMSWVPADDTGAPWKVCSPETAGDFSAVAYYYARELYERTGIPQGIIDASWAGTAIEPWISRETYETLPEEVKREFNHGLAGELERFQREVIPDLSRYADYREDDPGVAGRWYLDGTDDGDWDTMFVPQEWSTTPLARVDGTVWFRYGFEMPPLGDGCRATLSLGCVDDDDVTWINSTEVGRTAGYAVERFYDIPPGVLRPGRNTITVKVTDNSGGGGLTSAPEDLYIRITGGGEMTVPLAGEWKYRTGIIDDAFRATMLHPHSLLYGGMISPLTGLDITGIIWYQGESNVDNPAAYCTLFPALINDWRNRWGRMFPFYWVQLANYMGRKDVPTESAWAELRQAQDMALSQPFTGQAVAIDIGEADNIHPANKQEVGRRLALYALRDVYGHDVVASGPRFIGIAGNGQPDGGAEVAASVDGRPGNRRAGNASVGSRQENDTAGTATNRSRPGDNNSKAGISRRNRSRGAGARPEDTRTDDSWGYDARRDDTHADDTHAEDSRTDDTRPDDTRTDDIPQYQTPGAVTVLFRTYGLALTVPDGSGVVTGFELAGADGVYRRAEARITGDETVEVRSAEVHRPAAIRYGWADNPEVNLYNTEGLPAVPFEALIPVACE